MTVPQIVGFSSSNRVPGFYGETVYGAGALSAASIPLILLLVGTMLTGGTATPNQDIVDILDAETADAKFLPGSELSRLCYSALKVPGVKIKAAPVAEAGGAVGAAQVFTFGGSWSSAGDITFRVNGEIITYTAGSTDTVATTCTNVAALFNSNSRRPYTATATATQVILTLKSKGARGNNFISFVDTGKAPSGLTCRNAGPAWTGGATVTTSSPISFVVPTAANGFYYKCTTGGVTAASPEPTWPTTIGATVSDNGVVWTCWGKVLTGSATTWGGGAGTESVATLLSLITAQGFDRIVVAQQDSTNLGLWKTQVNNAAGPTYNLLQHLIAGVNGTFASAVTLATTLNSERLQLLWQPYGETNPAESAAYFAALRCSTEQGDPDAAYDDALLPNTAPNSQISDRPSQPVLQSAINNGLTVIYTDPTGTEARICRSVTTHTLTGSTPDYRTLDTSDAYVPDFVRRDIGLHWSTVFKPNNPRNADDPAPDQKARASGVATPSLWNADVEAKLRRYEKGNLSSNASPNASTVAPIIIDVDTNKPTSGYDPVAKRIMSIIPVVPAPNTHQIGVSVRNVSSA